MHIDEFEQLAQHRDRAVFPALPLCRRITRLVAMRARRRAGAASAGSIGVLVDGRRLAYAAFIDTERGRPDDKDQSEDLPRSTKAIVAFDVRRHSSCELCRI